MANCYCAADGCVPVLHQAQVHVGPGIGPGQLQNGAAKPLSPTLPLPTKATAAGSIRALPVGGLKDAV